MPSYREVPVSRLIALCNPVEAPPWPDSKDLCSKRIMRLTELGEIPYTLHSGIVDSSWAIEQHEKRIAFFVRSGWSDPIFIDVGIPELGLNIEWPVMDGNHRLAAAILRNDITILAEISGSIDLINQLFFD